MTPAPQQMPHAEGVSDEEFRAAMARLAAGVVLVTAHDAEESARGEDVGMTATAFMSVSLEPPLVLISVRTDSRMDELLTRQDLWAVSLLTDAQHKTAGRFAMKARLSDRLLFKELPHRHGAATGAPLVDDALAAIECRTEQRVAAGDHTLVIGRVLATHLTQGEGGPLTYFQGRYRSLR
ncbi:flavin reductase family protein [Streptomyces axinellae]|uniref:Flavin reductase family protein n=1 Tax=Streptomyces axinellae TaxID=552788 RepID=A0ABN3QCH8_9ACTN